MSASHLPSAELHYSVKDRILQIPDFLHKAHLKIYEEGVFGEGDWKKHRSSAWRHRLQPTAFVKGALGFFWQLLLVLVISVLTGLYHTILVVRKFAV